MKKGFTLVELLVSIAIFTIITSVAVLNHSSFNSSVLLTNLAYEIALSVRQAQFYGIVVKQSSTGSFDAGYGIHFDLGSSPSSYVLFEDRAPQDHLYNTGEAIETYKIQKGNTIGKIVLTTASGTSSQSVVDISFIRPNPDTFIRYGALTSNIASRAEVCVFSPGGTNKRKIIIEATGQISVSTDTTVCN